MPCASIPDIKCPVSPSPLPKFVLHLSPRAGYGYRHYMIPLAPALGEKYFPVLGEHSGLSWLVSNPSNGFAGQPEQPFYFGYLSGSDTGRHNDYELHFYALYDAAGIRHDDYHEEEDGDYTVYLNRRAAWMNQAGLRSRYDHLIHQSWPGFYAALQLADKEIAQRQQNGWPTRVAAHVGPTPPLLVDGINGDPLPLLTPAVEPTLQEQALLRGSNLHPTDLGYQDRASEEWL
jgi:hypothetical protein